MYVLYTVKILGTQIPYTGPTPPPVKLITKATSCKTSVDIDWFHSVDIYCFRRYY